MKQLLTTAIPDSLKPLLKKIYFQYYRTSLPKKSPILFNDVIVDYLRIGDFAPISPPVLRWHNPNDSLDYPSYESAIATQLRSLLSEGDTVVIVGGGFGVTAVIAARQVSPTGTVTVFEGGSTEVNMLNRTIHWNEVSEIVEVNHNIVGDSKKLRSDSGSAQNLSPKDLPKCDVLELDCEGTEIEILEDIEILPEILIVETHGHQGAPTSVVENKMKELEYEIVSKEIAERSKKSMCEKKDIYVLTGRQIND